MSKEKKKPSVQFFLNYSVSVFIFQLDVHRNFEQFLLLYYCIIFQDIPPVSVFGPGSYVKRGFLMKLELSHKLGGQKKWRRRFCILTPDRLFLYESEKSRGFEKNAQFIDLSNFQRCQRTTRSNTGGYFEFSLLDEETKGFWKQNVSFFTYKDCKDCVINSNSLRLKRDITKS